MRVEREAVVCKRRERIGVLDCAIVGSVRIKWLVEEWRSWMSGVRRVWNAVWSCERSGRRVCSIRCV